MKEKINFSELDKMSLDVVGSTVVNSLVRRREMFIYINQKTRKKKSFFLGINLNSIHHVGGRSTSVFHTSF
jgi:hypothetical protein